MNASLNEIESLCKKAARGAGLSWGLAEEGGKAARWLSANGLNGPALLAAQLRRDDGCPYPQLTPAMDDEGLEVPGQLMCPLIAGVTLSDHAYLLRDIGQVQLRRVAHPLLLLPFVSATARHLGVALHLSWRGCVIRLAPNGEVVIHHAEGLYAAQAYNVSCSCISAAISGGEVPSRSIPALDADVHEYLDHLAGRTYVPASAASRLLGAGSALSDNI